MWATGFLILISLALGIGAWVLFIWSVKSGQLDDPEGPKYRMLDDDDEEAGRDNTKDGHHGDRR